MRRLSEVILCEEVIDRMEAWLDGDLDEAEAVRIRHHIDACPECRAERRFAEDVQDQLGGLPSFDIPSHVLDAVAKQTGGEPGSKSTAGWIPRWTSGRVAAAAAIGAIALLIALIVPEVRRPSPRLSAEEVEAVADQTRLALAYLSDLTKRAEAQAASRIFEDRVAISRLTSMSRTLGRVLETDSGIRIDHENEGSL